MLVRCTVRNRSNGLASVGAQFSLGETFSRNKRKKEEAAAAAAAAPERICDVCIISQRPEDSLAAAMQHVRLDSMEHIVDNQKYSRLSTEVHKENSMCGMEDAIAGAELSDLGTLILHNINLNRWRDQYA